MSMTDTKAWRGPSSILVRREPASRYAHQPGQPPATKAAAADVAKVGPKGYEHGWVYVGPQAAGARAVHAATEEAALRAAPLRIEFASDGKTNIPQGGIGGHSRRDVFGALDAYAGRDYKDINGGLRRKQGDPAGLPKKRRDQVERIDAAMAHSKLTSDVTVYRGVKDPKAMFGDAWGDHDLAGLEWVDDGYTSTTAAERMRGNFARKQTSELPVVITIHAPKGTQAVQLSGMDDEAELLLHRGARFRVVRDHGVREIHGEPARHLDVEVVV